MVKNIPANSGDTRDVDSISGSGRSPGEGNGDPFQHSCLENSMDRGAWQTTVHGVPNSQILLSGWSHTHTHAVTYRIQSCFKHFLYYQLPSDFCLKLYLFNKSSSYCSCLRKKWQLGNPMDRRAWWATVHWDARVGHDLVTKQQTLYFYLVKGLQYSHQFFFFKFSLLFSIHIECMHIFIDFTYFPCILIPQVFTVL